jgi:hypothetical protein
VARHLPGCGDLQRVVSIASLDVAAESGEAVPQARSNPGAGQ